VTALRFEGVGVDRTAEAAEGTLMALRGWRRTLMDPDRHRAARSHPLSEFSVVSAFSGSRTGVVG